MSVPIFHELLLPILEHISDGNPHRPSDTLEHVLTRFSLSEDEVSERLPNGRTRVMDRVLWAITYLRKSGLLKSLSWGVFQITTRGREVLAGKPKTLGLKDLEKYPEYLEFKGKASVKNVVHEVAAAQETPEEGLQRQFTAIRQRLEGELLDALKASSPTFFEKVVLTLLVAMGYGGTIEDAASTTRRTGDDGIDGVIKEDRLGLDVIHIQAKRWTEKVVGRPEIQNFAGSLEGQRGRKGVFITTSSFSSDARDYVSRIEKKIILVDGTEFSKRCVDFGVGVVVQTSYSVKRLDSDFFIED